MRWKTHSSGVGIRSLILFCLVGLAGVGMADSLEGRFFLGLPYFASLCRRTVEADGSVVFTSPPLETPMDWDELVVSWNVEGETGWKIEASPRGPKLPADRFYTLGMWSSDTNKFPRQSIPGQKDDTATVETDTLRLSHPTRSVVIRLTASGTNSASARIRFVGLSFCDRSVTPAPAVSNEDAWGKNVEVPLLSQLDYPGGETKWCSPTSLTMMLRYWGGKTGKASLTELTVPATAAAVFDPNWPGTGNWPFNMAYAASLTGMRAYTARLHNLVEVEKWIEAGIPVALSVSYNRLKGKEIGGSGHLVVCTGFTKDGEVMINDPGVSLAEGKRVFPRGVVETAWAESRNTVYIIHPESLKNPPWPSGAPSR